jgi:hypothetical protein
LYLPNAVRECIDELNCPPRSLAEVIIIEIARRSRLQFLSMDVRRWAKWGITAVINPTGSHFIPLSQSMKSVCEVASQQVDVDEK